MFKAGQKSLSHYNQLSYHDTIRFLMCSQKSAFTKKAFMNNGLWVGFAGIPIIGIKCIHCMQTMLKCSRELSRRHNFPSLSYEETAEVCFKYGPRSFQGWSKIIGHIITSFLIMTQLGFCCAVRIQHLQKSR